MTDDQRPDVPLKAVHVPVAGVRNSGVDLLRGLAIVLVVLHHLGLRIPLGKTALAEVAPPWLLNRLNHNGHQAVLVFFVISGFLIASNILRRYSSLERVDVRAFYAQRFARIVPCLFVLLIVLSALHVLGVSDYVIKRHGQSLPRAVLAALGLHLNWYEGHTGYLPGNWDVLWSLSIEELFYFAFPVVCLCTRGGRVLVSSLVLLALSIPWTRYASRHNEIWQEKAYLPGMGAIAMGVLGALLAARWKTPARRELLWLGWLGAIGLTLVMLLGAGVWRVLRDGSLLLLTVSTTCLLLASRPPPTAGWSSTWTFAWLRSWGRLSYEIYLSHMFVVYSVVRLLRLAGWDRRWGFIWYVLAVPSCWLLGVAVERGLSGPCEQWLRGGMSPASSPSSTIGRRAPPAG
jgi:peptidoglycan/LPS O-acetylase OafA/YrhL